VNGVIGNSLTSKLLWTGLKDDSIRVVGKRNRMNFH